MSSYFHSASQSCSILSANCRYDLRLFRLLRGNSSGIDKYSSAKCLLYSDIVIFLEEEDEEAVTKKAISELEIFVSQIFHNFFLLISFFQLFYFILLLRSAPLEGRTCFCELYQICCSKRFNNDLSWKPTNRYNQKWGRTKRTRIRGKGWEKMARKRMKMMSMWASVELGSGVRSSVKPRPDRLRESGQSPTQMQDINNLV